MSVEKDRLERYNANADTLNEENAKTKVARDRLAIKKKHFIQRVERTARAELLNSVEAGYNLY